MFEKNSQSSKKKGGQGISSILRDLGYENGFIKEVAVWKHDDFDFNEFGPCDGYALYEKIIVIGREIFVMGFAEEGAEEVQKELEVLKKALLDEYGIATIYRVDVYPSHYFEFRNEATKEEFCNPY